MEVKKMLKKILIIGSVVMAVVVLGAFAVPALAADPAGSGPAATQQISRVGKAVLMARLLVIKDEARVDALLTQAVTNDKLTTAQAAKVKAFWTAHHEQFTKGVAGRLLKVQDEAKLKDFLNQAVSNGKIDQAQADRVIATWEKIHSQ
jgi:hypothetical protein